MSRKITIQIFPDGKVQAEVNGVKGKSCTDYIKIIEEILEAETSDSDYTPEYYESENTTETETLKKVRRVL